MEYDFIHSVTLIIGTLQNRLFRTGTLAQMKKRILQFFLMTYFFGFLIDCIHEERKNVLTAVKVLRMGSYPGYSVIPESSACGCQPEDGVFLSSRILNNNRRYWRKQ